MLGEDLLQFGLDKAVREMLDHYRGIWCRSQNFRMNHSTFRPFVEEWGDASHGKSVLPHPGWKGPQAGARVVGHAQVVEDQADVTRQALDRRGDGIAGLGLDGADGEAA